MKWERKPWEIIPGYETIPSAAAYARKMRSKFKKEYERLSKMCKDNNPCDPDNYKKCMENIQLWKDWSENYSWRQAAFHAYAWREEENFERYKKKYRDEMEGMRKFEEEKRQRMYENLRRWE